MSRYRAGFGPNRTETSLNRLSHSGRVGAVPATATSICPSAASSSATPASDDTRTNLIRGCLPRQHERKGCVTTREKACTGRGSWKRLHKLVGTDNYNSGERRL